VLLALIVLAIMFTNAYSIFRIRTYLYDIGLPEPLYTIRWIMYSGMFITVGIVAGLALLYVRQLTRPILRLREMAQQVASGQWQALEALQRDDELGDIAAALHQSASRLQQDNARLQALHQQQQQFLADIAHEVRTPLHTLLGCIEMLEADPDRQTEYIGLSQGQLDRLTRLFNDLLTLQRAELDPSQFVRPRGVLIADLAQQLLATWQPKADLSQLALRIEGPATIQVWADPHRLAQVLDNLVANALAHTDRGEVVLGWALVAPDAVEIWVRDTGRGIPTEHQARIWDRFYRADASRARPDDSAGVAGTGLGLAVVRQILEAHNTAESLRLVSRAGAGTEIRFSLRTQSVGH
jgi:signal transduction histidine kinase